MGLDAMENGIHIWKALIFSIKTCSTLVRNHPFVLGTVFLFFFLYRFLPSVLIFLISSSPTLVCTAVLLGTLLGFGHPKITEFKENETREISSLKGRVVEDVPVFDKDESFSAETNVVKGRDIREKAVEEAGVAKGSKAKRNEEKKVVFSQIQGDGLTCRTSVIEELNEIHGENQVIEEESDLRNLEFIDETELGKKKFLIQGVSSDGEDVKDQSSEVRKKGIEDLEVEIDKPVGKYPDIHLKDCFRSSQDSSGKQIRDNVESSDSGFDTESSSPDASTVEIIPVIDELHPLLNSKPTQPALTLLDDSDAVLEGSDRSIAGSVESDSENQEEEALEGEDDGTKAVVTWTEDDEKNLMDLGTSELERNQRLENLIAKRRARKILRMEAAEKNLIDLDSNDLAVQIAPILTMRNNPFDLPYYCNETGGLSSIPGSAPPILAPRGNPFDLPYDPLEERPNLTGDSFHQEFTTVHQKDMYFSRHESFSFGSSLSLGLKQEGRGTKLRPFFVTEGMASEGTAYTTLQRQLSDGSESKSSSVPETELLSSVTDQEDHKKLIEQELAQEDKLISHIDHASPDHLTQESQTSEEVDLEGIDQEGKSDLNLTSEGYMKSDVIEEYSESTLSSSSSEVNEKIFHVNTDEVRSENLEPTLSDYNKGSSISTQLSQSFKDSDLKSGAPEGVDDCQTKEPMYDSSPSAVERATNKEAIFFVDKGVVLTSTSSIASDLHVEVSEVGSPTLLVERTISLTGGESLSYNERIENEINSDNEGPWAASSDENNSRLREVTEISAYDFMKVGFSGANQDSDDPTAEPMVPESVVEQVLIDSASSPVDELTEGLMNQVTSSNANSEMYVGVHQSDLEEKVDPVVSSPSASEKTHPLIERLIDQPSCDDGVHHEESQEPSIKYTEEVNIINNVDELDVHETEDEDIEGAKENSDKSIECDAIVTSPKPMDESEVSSNDLEASNKFAETTESSIEVQVLEDTASTQPPEEEEVEKPMVLESIHDVPLLKEN